MNISTKKIMLLVVCLAVALTSVSATAIAKPSGDETAQVAKKSKKGKRGKTGKRGKKGDKGAKGDKGDRGDRGETGPAGANGTNGTNGVDGTSIAAGVFRDSGPTGELGEETVLSYTFPSSGTYVVNAKLLMSINNLANASFNKSCSLVHTVGVTETTLDVTTVNVLFNATSNSGAITSMPLLSEVNVNQGEKVSIVCSVGAGSGINTWDASQAKIIAQKVATNSGAFVPGIA